MVVFLKARTRVQVVERWVIIWLALRFFLVEIIVINLETQHTFFGRQLATHVQQSG